MEVEYVGVTKKEVGNDKTFLLSQQGSYIFLGDHNPSNYCGLTLFDNNAFTLTKVLHDIHVDSPTQKIRIQPERITRLRPGLSEQFFLRDSLPCYAASGTGNITLRLDLRDIYDVQEFGREHTITQTHQSPFVYEISCKDKQACIVSSQPLEQKDTWTKTDTPFDQKRGQKNEWWVYEALSIKLQSSVRIIVCPKSRLHEAKEIMSSPAIWEPDESGFKDIAAIAFHALESLAVSTNGGNLGILAGLPWFFQLWSRDEAIATGGLIARGQYGLAGQILTRQIQTILENGQIPNRYPHSVVGSADGVGWAFLRLHQIYEQSPESLPESTWQFVYQQLKTSLERLHTENGLIINNPQETWMDSTGNTGDVRDGARIEIQTLSLRQLSFAAQLASRFEPDRAKEFSTHETSLRMRVVDKFYDDNTGFLADGFTNEADWTIRPNCLLARYCYPPLLSKHQWIRAARTTLEILKTPWSGGIATIDPNHPLFTTTHSGASDASYHRGDSWYFINNLIAVALRDLDDSFQQDVQHITDAAVRELLFEGSLGTCAEISSFSEKESLGCVHQAWSASTLVELLR